MQRTFLSGMILGFLLFCCGGVLVASEVDELRERAKAMRREASVMAERGNKEQAERLMRESVELMEAAEQLELKDKGPGEQGGHPNIDTHVRHLTERLQALVATEQKMRDAKAPEKALAEVREQIAGTERELKMIHAHHARLGEIPPEIRAQAEQLEVATRRIHHLRVAAQNLKIAEVHDIAHQLMVQAESMERDVQEAKGRLAAQMQKAHGGGLGPDVVQDLRAEIERLRTEVKELRQKVEKR